MELIQMAKGAIVSPTELQSITATTTSNVQRARGHNAMIMYVEFVTGSGTWSVKVQGAIAGNGTFIDVYKEDGNAMTIASATASKAIVFKGIPEHFKIVATEDSNGATIKVHYELFTI